MAERLNTPTLPDLSRCRFATGAAVAGVIAALPAATALASPDQDSQQWLARWQVFIKANRMHTDAYCALEDTKISTRKAYPNPAISTWRPTLAFRKESGWSPAWAPSWKFLGHRHGITRQAFEELYDEEIGSEMVRAHPELIAEGEACRAKSLAAFDASDAQCAEIDRKFGIPDLAAAEAAAREAMDEAERDIIETSAEGFAGIAVKLALWVHLDGEPPEIEASMDAAEEPAAVSAWRDAVRLARLPDGRHAGVYRKTAIMTKLISRRFFLTGTPALVAAAAIPAEALATIAAASPIPAFPEADRPLLMAYSTWLHYERRFLCQALWPGYGCDAERWVHEDNPGADWHPAIERGDHLVFPPLERFEARARLIGIALSPEGQSSAFMER